MDEPIEWPIDGVLDLHSFRPQAVQDVVVESLAAYRERGILEVRVVYGWGIARECEPPPQVPSLRLRAFFAAIQPPFLGSCGESEVVLKIRARDRDASIH